MLFLRFFFLPCQDVFQGVKLPVLSIARQDGLACQLVLGQGTYVFSLAMETKSQNEPDMPCLLSSQTGCLVYLKQFSCLLNVDEASYTSTEVETS